MQTKYNFIKIILNEKPIYLVEDYKQALQEFGLTSAFILFKTTEKEVHSLIELLQTSCLQHALVIGPPQQSLELFKKSFNVIRAGGGIVRNLSGDILFIYRRKRWDLPKGKLDEGETIEACALREVIEETGVQEISLGNFICTCYHLYFEKQMNLKQTDWFEMKSTDQNLIPQAEEGIEAAVWVDSANMQVQLDNTYTSIRDILSHYLGA